MTQKIISPLMEPWRTLNLGLERNLLNTSGMTLKSSQPNHQSLETSFNSAISRLTHKAPTAQREPFSAQETQLGPQFSWRIQV